MTITLSTGVHIEWPAAEADAVLDKRLRALVALWPQGARRGECHLVLGRAGARDACAAFPTAAISDLRTSCPHGQGGLEAKHMPAAERYDLAAAAIAGGGFLALTRNCWRTGVPNLVRNLACCTKERAFVFASEPEAVARWSAGLYPDYSLYSECMPLSADAAGAGLAVALCANGEQARGFLERAAALAVRHLFIVAPPSAGYYAACRDCCSSVGGMVYNNSRSEMVAIRPIATPFADPARRPPNLGRSLALPATIGRMAGDGVRNDVIAATIMRTAAPRNIFLMEYIAMAGPLLSSCAFLNPDVLLPEYACGATERRESIARICGAAKAEAPDGQLALGNAVPEHASAPATHVVSSMCITYADAIALADGLPAFDHAYLCSPAGAAKAVAATACIRRRSSSSADSCSVSKAIYDFVDVHVRELALKAGQRHAALAKASPCHVDEMDRRYL